MMSKPKKHKRRGPKSTRAGCLMCKPWKGQSFKGVPEYRDMQTRRSDAKLKHALALVAVLFLAVPLAAQDQTLEPSGTVSETNSDCTTSNAHTRTSDNSDATFCDGGTGSPAESYNLLMSFATPTSSPSTVTDDQAFLCRAEKSDTTAGNGDPTMTMELFCAGVSVEVGGTHTVTGAVSEFTEAFTFGGSCTADGSDAEIRVNVVRVGGGPSGRRSIDIMDCDWDVTWAAAASRSRGHVIGERR